jgi:hypothetical protein
MSGDKPIAMVRLRSEIGIEVGVNGSFVLKNYEGNPDVILPSGEFNVPAGQEFSVQTRKFQAITASASLDELRQSMINISDGSGAKIQLVSILKKYKYYLGAGVVVILIIVLIIRSINKKKRRRMQILTVGENSRTFTPQAAPPKSPPQVKNDVNTYNTVNYNDQPTPAAGTFKFCPSCGETLREGSKFCGKCGYKLS